MRIAILLAWVLAAVAVASPAARAAVPAPVAAALSLLKHGGARLADGWRYDEQITNNKGSERLSYDPARAPGARWRVLAVNGKAPDAAERKRVKTAARKAAGQAGRKLSIGMGWLAASDYRLLKSTPKTLVYQLRPRPTKKTAPAAAHLLAHLSGEFTVARDDHRPVALRLENFESFSPRFGVRVEAFSFRARFKRLGETGPVVVVRTSNSAKGKVFWIKGFENKTKVVLSHFAPVASSAPAAQTGG